MEISEHFRVWLVETLRGIGIETEDFWWNDGSGIRKLGHVMEYGLLGMASAIAFFDGHRAVKSVVISLAFCVAVSVLDQVVKIFVPIRHFDVTDLPFDAIGSVAGILFITVIGMIFSRGA